MARVHPKSMYSLAVTRGRITKFYYGLKLKDAIEAAGLKPEESFTYTKFVAGDETTATWHNDNSYSAVR